MKMVIVEKPVRDVNGLLRKLQDVTPSLGIVNVGADARRTYIYLDDAEDQDPTPHVAEWRDPAELRLVPMNAEGPSGLPEAVANGDEAHVVLIEKISGEQGDVLDGKEELVIRCHGVIERMFIVQLERGATSVQIGPVRKAGQVVLSVRDPRGKLGFAEVKLQFVPEYVEPPPPPVPHVVEPQEGAEQPASEMLVADVGQPIGAGEEPAPTQEAPPKRKWFWQRIFGR